MMFLVSIAVRFFIAMAVFSGIWLGWVYWRSWDAVGDKPIRGRLAWERLQPTLKRSRGAVLEVSTVLSVMYILAALIGGTFTFKTATLTTETRALIPHSDAVAFSSENIPENTYRVGSVNAEGRIVYTVWVASEDGAGFEEILVSGAETVKDSDGQPRIERSATFWVPDPKIPKWQRVLFFGARRVIEIGNPTTVLYIPPGSTYFLDSGP